MYKNVIRMPHIPIWAGGIVYTVNYSNSNRERLIANITLRYFTIINRAQHH